MATSKTAACVSLAVWISAVGAVAQERTSRADGLPTVAPALLEKLRENPQRARDAILAGIEGCFLGDAAPAFESSAVRKAAVDLHIAYFELIARQTNGADHARMFAELVEQEDAKLSPAEKKEWDALKESGMYQGRMLLCIAATAHGLLIRYSE